MHDLTGAVWRKSSFSGSGNACVEVAHFDDGYHAMRDSKNPTGPKLIVTTTEWIGFTTGVCGDKFD